MRNIVKVAAVALLVSGLAACDGNTKDTTPTAGASAATASTPLNVTLLDGKVSFTAPLGMVDQSDKLQKKSNNVFVYADNSGQKAVIVILEENINDSLSVLAQRLETKQRNDDANLQVLTNAAIEIDGVPFQKLETVINKGKEKTYSCVLLGKVNNRLMTLQLTEPEITQQLAQAEAEKLIASMKIIH